MNYFANPSNFYSSGPSSQQTPYNRVAKQEVSFEFSYSLLAVADFRFPSPLLPFLQYPYEDLSLATPSLEQSWFGANVSHFFSFDSSIASRGRPRSPRFPIFRPISPSWSSHFLLLFRGR